MAYGVQFNCAITEQDGKYEGGVKINSTQGLDIDYKTNQNNYADLINDLIDNVMKEYDTQINNIREQKKAEKSQKQNQEQINELWDYINELEDTVAALQQENQTLKVDLQHKKENVKAARSKVDDELDALLAYIWNKDLV